MAKILLVEDDQFFRDSLKDYLESKDHEVDVAPNGRVARDMVFASEYEMILSDIQMPHLNGIELLQWIRKKSDIPVIMMTGFSHLIENQTAASLGASDLLTKPFTNRDLLESVGRVIKGNQPENEDAEDIKYCKVSIEEFVAKSQIDFDVYVKLSNTKYVKIGRRGDLVPVDRIDSYKGKGLSYLYISMEDFSQLVEFNLTLSKVIESNDKVSHEKKVNFMKYTGEIILEKCFVAGFNEKDFEDTKHFVVNSVSVITESKDSFDLLSMLNSHADWIYAHCIGVSMYSIMIARNLGLRASSTFFKLSMAGIFHDIGKKEIERELLEKPRPLMSQAERNLLETHVTRGKEILSYLKNVPDDVIQLVYEHHEDQNGQGFPRGLSRQKLHPLSKILQLANLFSELVVKRPNGLEMDAVSAIKQIETLYLGQVDPKALHALKLIVGYGGK